jgi:hypothetical protein
MTEQVHGRVHQCLQVMTRTSAQQSKLLQTTAIASREKPYGQMISAQDARSAVSLMSQDKEEMDENGKIEKGLEGPITKRHTKAVKRRSSAIRGDDHQRSSQRRT